MRKILVVTGTRAEYGLLYWTMKRIQQDEELELQLIVTGSHLVKEYGYTVDQIIKDGFFINERIDMLVRSEEKSGLVKSMGLELIQMGQAFDHLQPDILLILGDRYETFIAATCAMMMNIPIAHMNGGESTEGAIDEQIRHAITKMAHLHFPGTDRYKENIKKMGEEEWRIANVGEAGVENIARMDLLTRAQLANSLNLSFEKPIFIITFHPVTLESELIRTQITYILQAIDSYNAELVFTYPNADFGSEIITDAIFNYVQHRKHSHIFSSLGQKKYLSLMKYAHLMIGNSSSGLLESPIFNLPVVNIGSRQDGRIRCDNVIDTKCTVEAIRKSINLALNERFRKNVRIKKEFLGDGQTSGKVVNILKTIPIDKKLMKKKLTYIDSEIR